VKKLAEVKLKRMKLKRGGGEREREGER